MQIELKRIQIDVGLTFVHVTHDQEEAMTMADTIAVMNKGLIEQMGAPEELYENPRTTFVANFLGQSNLIAGRRRRRPTATDLVVDIDGTKIAADKNAGQRRRPAASGSAYVPRRCSSRRSPTSDDDEINTIARRRRLRRQLRRASSTQYLVRMPWGQELSVFEQNTGRARAVRAGHAGRPALERRARVPARPRPRCPRRRRDCGRRLMAVDRLPRPRGDQSTRHRQARIPTGYLPAAARRALAGPVLRRPVLLAGRDEPLRPGRRRRSAATT